MDQIQKFKRELVENNIHGLALDIDETLADSNTHWFKTLCDFKQPKGQTFESIIKKYIFAEEIVEWQTTEAFEVMQGLMNSEEFNEGIPLIEDSNHVVNKLNQTFPILAYITARPSTVAEATKRWLTKHDFPVAELITRSNDIKTSASDLSDRNKWKAEILVELYPHITGIIDDNVVLAHKLQDLNYKGTLYLYGTDTKEFDHYIHVVVCPTWSSVYDKIKKTGF